MSRGVWPQEKIQGRDLVNRLNIRASHHPAPFSLRGLCYWGKATRVRRFSVQFMTPDLSPVDDHQGSNSLRYSFADS
mgnify:CR=1 FL=1